MLDLVDLDVYFTKSLDTKTSLEVRESSQLAERRLFKVMQMREVSELDTEEELRQFKAN